jgi:hypothetical protein
MIQVMVFWDMIPYYTAVYLDVSEEHIEVFVFHSQGNNMFSSFIGEELTIGVLKLQKLSLMDRGNQCPRDFQFSAYCFIFFQPRVRYGNQPKALVVGEVCHLVIGANIVWTEWLDNWGGGGVEA